MTGAAAQGTIDRSEPQRQQPFTIVHSTAGRVRMRLRPPAEERYLRAAAAFLEAADGVTRVTVHGSARSVIVEFQKATTDPAQLLKAAQLAVPEDYGFKTLEVDMKFEAPADKVWTIIADPRYLAEYLPQSVRVQEVRNPLYWVVEFTLFGRRFREEVRVVERVHGERLVIRADGSFAARMVVTLHPSNGTTLVREKVDYLLPSGVLASVLGQLSSRRLRKGLRSHLASLAALATAS